MTSFFKNILFLPTMYIYCVYPAMSKYRKLCNFTEKWSNSGSSNHFQGCLLSHPCYCSLVIAYHSFYMNWVPEKVILTTHQPEHLIYSLVQSNFHAISFTFNARHPWRHLYQYLKSNWLDLFFMCSMTPLALLVQQWRSFLDHVDTYLQFKFFSIMKRKFKQSTIPQISTNLNNYPSPQLH